jgi:hypothetical protein
VWFSDGGSEESVLGNVTYTGGKSFRNNSVGSTLQTLGDTKIATRPNNKRIDPAPNWRSLVETVPRGVEMSTKLSCVGMMPPDTTMARKPHTTRIIPITKRAQRASEERCFGIILAKTRFPHVLWL